MNTTTKPTKLGQETRDYFKVEKVHMNDTLTTCHGLSLIDRVNICYVQPFFQDQVIQNRLHKKLTFSCYARSFRDPRGLG